MGGEAVTVAKGSTWKLCALLSFAVNLKILEKIFTYLFERVLEKERYR